MNLYYMVDGIFVGFDIYYCNFNINSLLIVCYCINLIGGGLCLGVLIFDIDYLGFGLVVDIIKFMVDSDFISLMCSLQCYIDYVVCNGEDYNSLVFLVNWLCNLIDSCIYLIEGMIFCVGVELVVFLGSFNYYKFIV